MNETEIMAPMERVRYFEGLVAENLAAMVRAWIDVDRERRDDER